MARPSDPSTQAAVRPRVAEMQARDLCGWCLGAGQYLEALDCDVGHVYLPVVCRGCEGRGRAGPR